MLISSPHNLNLCSDSQDTRFLWNVFEAVQKTRSTCFIGSKTTRLRLVALNLIKHSCSFFKHYLNFYISNTSTTQKCPYVFTVEKSIIVETSVQYSIQKYNHLRADSHMTANIKSLVFYVIMTPFPFYKNMLNFSG